MVATLLGRSAVAVLIASFVAGCGSARSALGPQPSDQTLALGAKSAQRLLYISTQADQTTHGLILVYPAGIHQRNAQLIRKFYADRPVGIWVDSVGVLYIVNTFNNGPCSLAEYQPGTATPFLTITNGLGDARTATVDARGNVYVNTVDLSSGIDVVVEYGPGGTQPIRTIPLPIRGYHLAPAGIALGARGNLFVAVFLPQFSDLHVFRIPAGSSNATDLNLRGIPGGGDADSGIAFDPDGNLYVAGVLGTGVYAPGAKTPFRKISSASGGFIAIDKTNGALYDGNEEFAPGGDVPANSVQLPFNTNVIGDAVGPSGL